MMDQDELNQGEDMLWPCLIIQSAFHNNTSSWDGRTDFYGMTNEHNHRKYYRRYEGSKISKRRFLNQYYS